MTKTLIGRIEEQKVLQKALDSKEAEMVAVIGRRRVGKTFLIDKVYRKKMYNLKLQESNLLPAPNKLKILFFN